MKWQPIETAPKDGQTIEVAWIVNWPIVEATVFTRWDRGEWLGHFTPTHWRFPANEPERGVEPPED